MGAIICALAIELRFTLENDKTSYYGFWSNIYNEKKLSELHKFVTTLIATFIGSVVVYYSMYFLFLYGGGQLSNNKLKSASVTNLFKKIVH